MRALAKAAGVSERFLVQLEAGEGNISVARLEDVAEALGTTGAELLASARAACAGRGAPSPRARRAARRGQELDRRRASRSGSACRSSSSTSSSCARRR